MHLCQAGIDMIYIRDTLGHTDIATTEVSAKWNIHVLRISLEEILNCPLTNSLIGKKITLLWLCLTAYNLFLTLVFLQKME